MKKAFKSSRRTRTEQRAAARVIARYGTEGKEDMALMRESGFCIANFVDFMNGASADELLLLSDSLDEWQNHGRRKPFATIVAARAAPASTTAATDPADTPAADTAAEAVKAFLAEHSEDELRDALALFQEVQSINMDDRLATLAEIDELAKKETGADDEALDRFGRRVLMAKYPGLTA